MIDHNPISKFPSYEVVRYCYVNEGWTQAECADVLGLSLGAFQAHVRRYGRRRTPEQARAAVRLRRIRQLDRAAAASERFAEAQALASDAAAAAVSGAAAEAAPGAPAPEPDPAARAALLRLGESLRRLIEGQLILLQRKTEAEASPEPGAPPPDPARTAATLSSLTRSLTNVTRIEAELTRLQEGASDDPPA